MKLTKIEDITTKALSKQIYQTDVGYDIKVVTIGPDTHIIGKPSYEEITYAPIVNFISKESGVLDIKQSCFMINEVEDFINWMKKATELLKYIYEHYEEFIPHYENEFEKIDD